MNHNQPAIGKYKMIMIKNKKLMRTKSTTVVRNTNRINGLPKYTPINQSAIEAPRETNSKLGRWKFIPRLVPIDNDDDWDSEKCDGAGFPLWDIELDRIWMERQMKYDLQMKKYSGFSKDAS